MGIGDFFSQTLTKVFGSKNEREVRDLWPYVEEINGFYESLSSLSDEELKGKTAEFRSRLEEGEELDDIMCEAFACVKEACRRLVGKKWMVTGHEITWDMIPFDCQLIGGIVLHKGKIAEWPRRREKSCRRIAPLSERDSRKGAISSRSTIISSGAMSNGTEKSTNRSHDRGQIISDTSTEEHKKGYAATSPMGRTTSSDSTICAITWRSVPKTRSSAIISMPCRRGGLGAH